MKEATSTKGGRVRWPLIIVALLGGHATLMFVAVSLAVGDPSFAVVPDYYGKAVRWDAQRAAERQSEALGWTLTLKPGSFADERGRRHVECELVDAAGAPVSAEQVTLTYYRHAAAGTVMHATLSPSGTPGRFAATIPLPEPGFWRFDAEAEAHGQAFVAGMDLEVRGGGAVR